MTKLASEIIVALVLTAWLGFEVGVLLGVLFSRFIGDHPGAFALCCVFTLFFTLCPYGGGSVVLDLIDELPSLVKSGSIDGGKQA